MFKLFIACIVATSIVGGLTYVFSRTDKYQMNLDGPVEPLWFFVGIAFFIAAVAGGYEFLKAVYVFLGFKAKFPTHMKDDFLTIAFGVVNAIMGGYLYFRAFYVVMFLLFWSLIFQIIF